MLIYVFDTKESIYAKMLKTVLVKFEGEEKFCINASKHQSIKIY
jgi:hypothetical protein